MLATSYRELGAALLVVTAKIDDDVQRRAEISDTAAGEPVSRPIPEAVARPAPEQPAGRTPARQTPPPDS
jgi:hypothetical protein